MIHPQRIDSVEEFNLLRLGLRSHHDAELSGFALKAVC